MSGSFPANPAPSALKIQSYQPTRVSLSHNLRRSVRTNGAQRWVITADWVGSQWVDFQRTPGRHTNDPEEQIWFPGDRGFKFVTNINQQIKWGAA